MARPKITSFSLYKYRYIIGYLLLAVLFATLLILAGIYVPGGLSANEKLSVIDSAAMTWRDPRTWLMIDAPYHLLQAGILSLFGASEFTIKLPSLIIGLLTGIGLLFLLRRWFPASIAVLASTIAIVTGQFLFIAQSGAPLIMHIFWPVLILLLGTQVTRTKSHRFAWKIVFTIAAALSLYTPLSIYVLLAVVATIALHPHLRLTIKRMSVVRISTCVAIAIILTAPLIWLSISNSAAGLELLGLSQLPIDVVSNLKQLASQYLLFWQPDAGEILTPVFGLATTLLIGLGVYRLIRTSQTTRSYLIMIWLLLLAPIAVLHPESTAILTLPAVLLLAAGLTSLIKYWYRLFPLNPYARIAGLIPIVVLISVMLGSGIDRYMYGYHYAPGLASNFSRDLALLPSDTNILVVTEEEADFYKAIADYRDKLSVLTTIPDNGTYAMTAAAYQKSTVDPTEISQIITNESANNANRFYIVATPNDKN
ncbi:hypothetical protein B7Y94_01345 [Candidatus Saccharibacteria bacterium 32-49-12]|nr:MAG: hypothetical protein B7Y94_01345 [Candidatus Saccharibacteria bacterium 32-49-12]